MQQTEPRYLELLAQSYPTAAETAAEIAELKAALTLPKRTHLFASDVHGEYTAFSDILRKGSDAVRTLVDNALGGNITPDEEANLVTLIAYPEEKLELMLEQADNADALLSVLVARLSTVAGYAALTLPRSDVESLINPTWIYLIETLLERGEGEARSNYRTALVAQVVEVGRADELVEELCLLIGQLAVDCLHLVGDVYDRGPNPELILDELMDYPSLDIQWGNHDVVWMGAALGQPGCIAHVVRNCARYGNLDILTDAYGIDLAPLTDFALSAYADDPCVAFGLKGDPGLSPEDLQLNIKVQKAMAVLQFKVEAQLIDEYPDFDLASRKLLHQIDFTQGTVVVDGTEYALTDTVFPTVDPANPYALTPEEAAVMDYLSQAFLDCERLQGHIGFLLDNGSLYEVCDGNLLLHACVPLNEDGSLKEVTLFGQTLSGKALYDALQTYVFDAFRAADASERKRGRDILWYLWLGEGSPLFAKSKMATFELYLIAEKEARKEEKNSFYKLFDDPRVYDNIFADFGLDPQTAHIICGHVPVKVKDGEEPVKAGGKVICIDGGYSCAYQGTTGIAGFTLVSNANGLSLESHEPLASQWEAIAHNAGTKPKAAIVESHDTPQTVADTDEGAELQQLIDELECLLDAYDSGSLAETD